MKVPHRWELHLAHLELDHPLGFSLNPLWKVWVLLAPQVLAELSHTVGARNPKPKNTVHSPRKSKLQNPKPKNQDPESKIPTPKSKASLDGILSHWHPVNKAFHENSQISRGRFPLCVSQTGILSSSSAV